MTFNFKLLMLAASALAAGCKANSQQPPPPQPRAAPSPSAPILVKWTERGRTESTTQLSLEVTKLVKTERPLTLRFSVPPGVLAEPQLIGRELEASFVGTSTTNVVLNTQGQPEQDLIAICDSQGTSFGFHAEVPYRFGRPEPVIAEPKLGEPIQTGPGQIRPVQLGK